MRGAVLVLAAAPALAYAQTQQVVKPPIAQYWVSVETAAGMSMPGMGATGSMMSGMMGGPGQSGRRMALQLGSQQAAAGNPQADHAIPPGMNMGPSLPLVTPERVPAPRAEREVPEGVEPKGRMLIYWGCGENVRPGQPVIIDYAKVSQGQAPQLASRRVARGTPPAFGRNRTYGDWPNRENAKPVPADASIKGEHRVKGNYAPEIRFTLGEPHEIMEQVALSNAANKLQWKSVPHATGYFAMLFGAAKQDEVVLWSSSEVQEMGGMLMDYIPPAEVARLVREKVVLAPSVTDCTVPGEVVQKAGSSPFLNFIAYGPEANFVQPPRPADPKLPWEQVWTAKVRFKSTASLLLGESSGGERGGRPERRARPEREAEAPQREAQPQQPAAPDPIGEGVKALRGIFGR